MRLAAIALVILAATPAVSRAGIDPVATSGGATARHATFAGDTTDTTLTVTGVIPFEMGSNGLYERTVTGAGFLPGVQIELQQSGETPIAGTVDSVAADGRSLACTFVLDDAPYGPWDVIATNPGGEADTLDAGVLIVSAPTNIAIVPAIVGNDRAVEFLIDGNELHSVNSVAFEQAGQPTRVASSVIHESLERLQVTCDLTGAAGGHWTLVLTTSQLVHRLPTMLRIVPTPVLDSIAPPRAGNGLPFTLTLHGRNFLPGEFSAELRRTGLLPLRSQSAVVAPDGRSAQVTFVPAFIPPGPINAVAVNAGLVESNPVGFTLLQAPRTLRLTPPAAPDTGRVTINASGTGYHPGASVKLSRSDAADIAGTDVAVVADSLLTAKFDLTGAATGAWDFSVRNPDGLASTLAGGFRVGIVPVIDSIAPRSGNNTQGSITLTVFGRQLGTGSQVALVRGAVVRTAFSHTVFGSTRIDARIDLGGLSPGAYDVRVTNNPGGASATLPRSFDVSGTAVITVTPAFGLDSSRAKFVQITGPTLLPGTVVSLTLGETVLTAYQVSVENNNIRLSAVFDLRGAPPGAYDLQLDIPDGRSFVRESGFRIDLVPIVTVLAPATGLDTDVLPITVVGGRFTPGCTFSLIRGSVASIPASDETVNANGTQLTGTVDLRGAPLGLWHVRVSNPQNTAHTDRFNLFSVQVGPRVEAMVPPASEPLLDVAASITGTDFQPGVEVTLEHEGFPDIAGTNETVDVGGTGISVHFNLTGAELGPRDIVILNPDGRRAKLVDGFRVIAGPTIQAVSPSSAPDTGLAILALTGAGFAPGLQTWLSRAGEPDIPGTAVLVGGIGTGIQATFDLSGKTLGSWDVVVQNPSLQQAVLPASFEIRASVTTFASGLDLTWDACNLPSSGGTSNATFDCANPDFVRSLYGNFQSPVPVPGFVALDAVIDIETGAATLPPFWHFNPPDGCNANGLVFSDARPTALCPTTSNRSPWGTGGNASDAFITAYAPGVNGGAHARLLLTVARSSTDPFSIEGGTNHYAFHLTWTGSLTQCEGCTTPAEITWTQALLHSAGTVPPVLLTGTGERSAVATINGGISGLGLTAVVPDRALTGTFAVVRALGRDLGGVTELALTYPGRADIIASNVEIDPDGRAVTGSFDLTAALSGKWSVRARAGASSVELSQGLRVMGTTPEVLIMTPNGGEIVPTSRDNLVTWEAVDNHSVTTVDFWISRNGTGGPWELIATDRGNTGSGTYRVQGASTDFALFRVVAHDAEGNTGMDESDAYFTIGTPTATLLARFEAVRVTEGVDVKWAFTEPGRVASAELDRAPAEEGPWSPVQAVHRTRDGETVVQDRDAGAASSHYRLRAVTRDGVMLTFGPISVAGEDLPTVSGVTSIAPNPATSRARLRLAVAREDRVRVTVMDLMGREVGVLVDDVLPPGRHELAWDARFGGRALPAGMYFVRYADRSRTHVTRLVLAP